MSTSTARVLAITLLATLPIVGSKTLTLKEPLSPVEDSVASELLALDGGKLTGTASVTKSEDGVEVSISVEVPIVGAKTFSLDEKLTGLSDEAVDELLALDNGSFEASVTVTEEAA